MRNWIMALVVGCAFVAVPCYGGPDAEKKPDTEKKKDAKEEKASHDTGKVLGSATIEVYTCACTGKTWSIKAGATKACPCSTAPGSQCKKCPAEDKKVGTYKFEVKGPAEALDAGKDGHFSVGVAATDGGDAKSVKAVSAQAYSIADGYKCEMCPGSESDKAGKCPKCKMALKAAKIRKATGGAVAAKGSEGTLTWTSRFDTAGSYEWEITATAGETKLGPVTADFTVAAKAEKQ